MSVFIPLPAPFLPYFFAFQPRRGNPRKQRKDTAALNPPEINVYIKQGWEYVLCIFLHICACFAIFRGRSIKIIGFGCIFLDLTKCLHSSKDLIFFEKKGALRVLK
jgi:hypothetical protein